MALQGEAYLIDQQKKKNKTEEIGVISIAQPEKAQKALEESSDAFDLSKEIKTVPNTIDEVVDTSLSDNYIKELQGYGLPTGTLKDLQELINSWGENTTEERATKIRAQKALENLSSSGISFYENPYLKTSAAEQNIDNKVKQQELDAQYERERALLLQRGASAKASEDLAYKRTAEQGAGATGALNAKYGTNREGVISTTNPLLATEFSAGVQEQLSVYRQQLSAAQAERANLLVRMDEAKKQNDDELASAISTELADVGNQIMEIQQEAATQQAKNSAEAFERITKLSDLSKDAGGGIFTGWTPQDIADTFGIDIATASTVANIDARIASTDTSQIDYAQKVANLRKTQHDILKSGLPLSAQEFIYYKNLYKTDPISAEKYAKSIGMGDDIIGDWNTGEMAKLDKSIKFYDSNNIAIPNNSKYEFIVSADSVTWDIPIGSPPDELRWQCGEFANDALGKPSLFKDSYKQKMNVTNSNSPVAGGAVVFNTGDWTGHVGLIEQVFENGYTVRDSNRAKNANGIGIVDTMFVEFDSEWDNMVDKDNNGFYDPYASKKADSTVLMKFQNVRVSLPTRLVDSDKDVENLQKVIDAYPNATSTEIKRRFVLGEEYDILPEDTKNVIDQLLDISSGITSANFNPAGVITQAKRGNFISPINTVENLRLKESVDPDYNIFNSERNLKMIGMALDLVNEQGENIGKIQGNLFKLGKKGGLNNAEAQRVETLLTWMIAPVRNQIAGTAVTEYEEIFLYPIIPSITDPEENLKSKLQTLKDAYMFNYNSARSASGLPELVMDDIKNPQNKVNKYMQGTTLQTQQDEGNLDNVWDDTVINDSGTEVNDWGQINIDG